MIGEPSVTRTNIRAVASSIFAGIDPSIAGTKYEDTLVPLLKCLRYPHTISKTALSAAGSPHTWPALVTAINWLAELTRYDTARSVRLGGAIGHGSAVAESDLIRDGDHTFFAGCVAHLPRARSPGSSQPRAPCCPPPASVLRQLLHGVHVGKRSHVRRFGIAAGRLVRASHGSNPARRWRARGQHRCTAGADFGRQRPPSTPSGEETAARSARGGPGEVPGAGGPA